MNFARWLFRLSGAIGLVALLPQYFIEERFGRDFPAYRLLMIPAMLEKFTFAGAVAVLFWQGRVATTMLGFAGFDFTLGVLFVVAWFVTPPKGEATRA